MPTCRREAASVHPVAVWAISCPTVSRHPRVQNLQGNCMEHCQSIRIQLCIALCQVAEPLFRWAARCSDSSVTIVLRFSGRLHGFDSSSWRLSPNRCPGKIKPVVLEKGVRRPPLAGQLLSGSLLSWLLGFPAPWVLAWPAGWAVLGTLLNAYSEPSPGLVNVGFQAGCSTA